MKSEISTAKSELKLRKLNRNQKFLKKNLNSKPEISIESESKNMNALLLINFLLNSSSEIRNFSSTLKKYLNYNEKMTIRNERVECKECEETKKNESMMMRVKRKCLYVQTIDVIDQ